MSTSDKVVPQTQSPLDEATSPPPHSNSIFRVADVVLRLLLFALSVVAVMVAVINSNQTETVPVMLPPMQTPTFVSAQAKFSYTPAIIYMVVALSVAGLYSIITTILSFYALLKLKPAGFSTKLLVHLVVFDILFFGIVTAATGAAGSIAYTGIKGNSHIGWQKLCGTFDKFCWRVGTSIVLCFFASAVLMLLALLSVYDMSKKIRK